MVIGDDQVDQRLVCQGILVRSMVPGRVNFHL